MFPERHRAGRRFLVLAVLASLLIHLAGGSLWAWLAHTLARTPPPEAVAQADRIVIERRPTPSPVPTASPTPEPTPRPLRVLGAPTIAKRHESHHAQPRPRELPKPARATLPPRAEPTIVPRIGTVHRPRTQQVAAVTTPYGAGGAAPQSGALNAQAIAALDDTFRKTIDQAQHDAETAPQQAIQFNGGTCHPLEPAVTRGDYRYYMISCLVRYSDGYRERVAFPWPYRFTPAEDPFAQPDGKEHDFPPQAPPESFVLPRPFTVSRAVCMYYHDVCADLQRRDRTTATSSGE